MIRPHDPRAIDRSEFPHPIFNWLSITGLALLSSSLAGVVFFLLIGLVTSDESSYAILTVLPPLLLGILGFLLVVILGGHPKPAIRGHLKTGHRRRQRSRR